jgi:hypothetical protein
MFHWFDWPQLLIFTSFHLSRLAMACILAEVKGWLSTFRCSMQDSVDPGLTRAVVNDLAVATGWIMDQDLRQGLFP